MTNLIHTGTFLGAPLIFPVGASEITTTGSGSSLRVAIVDYGVGVTTVFNVVSGAIGSVVGQSSHSNARTAISTGGFSGTVLTDTVTAVLAGGPGGSVSAYLTAGANFDQKVELASLAIGGQTFLFAAACGGSGFSVLNVQSGASLTLVADVADTVYTYASGIASLATVQIGTRSFVFCGSATESGISVYEVASNGTLSTVDSVGTGQLVSTEGVTDLAIASVDGVSYLVGASAVSSSLTVFEIAADGYLTPVDHVVDDLATRFQGVSVMDVATVSGRVYVVAAGSDGGLTLLTLLPGGQLLHLQSLADTATSVLSNISAIRIVPVGPELQVFVTSASEAGMSMFRIDLSSLGVTMTGSITQLTGTSKDDVLVQVSGNAILSGGAGADVLRDGTGADQLHGGAGADTFILVADGVADVIMDFELGKDRIDLSLLPYLRNVNQLTITPIAGGATILYGSELLTVLTVDGRSLTVQDFSTFDLLNLTRFPVARATPRAVWHGTALDDTLLGTSDDELFVGLEGNDVFVGGGGADEFDGGSGFDIVDYSTEIAPVTIDLMSLPQNAGAAPGDIFVSIEGVIGTSGNDIVRTDNAHNQLWGGDGHDFLDGRGGHDTICGGLGNDSILGRDGDDVLNGDDGNDIISGSLGNDLIYGGGGNDEIGGGDGTDTIYGGSGNDVIGSGSGRDLIDCGLGNDIASGGWGHDTLFGGPGKDNLAGSYDNDLVTGEAGDDSLGGGDGDDTLDGGSGNDLIGGGPGNDLILGGDGDDFLGGADGDDQMFGGAGNDTLNAGAGNDELDGGIGADTFVFAEYASGEVDIIVGFEDGLDMLRFLNLPGTSAADKFTALTIEIVWDGSEYVAEASYVGHAIRLPGIGPGQLDFDDFVFF
ncbi:calcium-binding protein [Defluviimonas aestuarii]|uniref:calcium-binding protein n=1 Tax=Albidovulum aestuarii TaxID=1130726 RepID=UPI00249A68EC|nr:calcium-binding protein [Defluviimonas aestuarii]